MGKAALKRGSRKVVLKRCRNKRVMPKYDKFRNGQFQYEDPLENNSREVENYNRKHSAKKIEKKTNYRQEKKAKRRAIGKAKEDARVAAGEPAGAMEVECSKKK